MYYLQSRYYDPNTGRFINADDAAYVSIYAAPLCNDLFSYCQNTCINGMDSSGYFFISKIAFTVVFAVVVIVSTVVLLKRSSSNSKLSKTVTVISCTPNGWIKSSTVMGKDMANAFGNKNSYDVKPTATKAEFESSVGCPNAECIMQNAE